MKILAGVAGLLFAIAAVVLGVFYPAKSLLTFVFSLAALVLLAFFLLTYFEAFKTFSRKRATQLGLNSVLMAVFFVFITIMLNLIVSQYYFRYDLSSTRMFTLSPQTESVVGGLDRELKVLAFIGGRGAEHEDTIKMLDGYRYFNHRLVYSVYDLDVVPTVAERYGVAEYNTSVLVYDDDYVKVDGTDEESITNGIIRITRKQRKSAYFVEGHGEHTVADGGRTGLSKAAESLAAMGYEIRSLNLATVEKMPSDADVVVVAGPEIEFSERELGMLSGYAGKGRVLLLLDNKGAHLDDFLDEFYVMLKKGLVSEPEKKMAGADENVPLVDSYPDNPVTKDFNLSTVYPTITGIKTVPGLGELYEYMPMVRSSPKSLLRSSEDRVGEAAIRGPIMLALLVKYRKTDGRIVLFADSDFVTNEYIDIAGNGNMFRNAVSYLVGETDLVSIAPEKAEFVPLYITDDQADAITYVFMIGLPLAVTIAGFMVWLKRRGL
jgi:ABC-type uncharacterized transport system involved in gliding motility auxiliary subunit